MRYADFQQELTVRTRNCLENAGIVSMDELLRRTRFDLRAIYGFGAGALGEVTQALSKYGLQLNPYPGKTMKPKPSIIGLEYAETIRDAAALHNPVKGMCKRLEDVLLALGALDVRHPNDWQFGWTGYVELRWYNGNGDTFGGSGKDVELLIMPDSMTIKGRTRKGYNDTGRVDIPGLSDEDAMKVFRVLLNIVDKPNEEA